MGPFSERELEHLRSHHVAHLATITASGGPHVVPIGYVLSPDGDAIDIGGYEFGRSKKYRDLRRNPSVAIVIDDFAGGSASAPRGVEVRGVAQLHPTGGPARLARPRIDPQWVRIVPTHIYSWGLEASAFTSAGRSSRDVGGGDARSAQ